MLATTLNKPQTMEIALPSKDKIPGEEQTTVKASKAITILLGKDNALYYYEGTRENNIDPILNKTNYSPAGLRQFLLKRNYEVMAKVRALKEEKEKKRFSEEEYEKRLTEIRKDKNAPIVLIKATDESVYRNLIDALDEMAICNIERYAIDTISPFDLDLIAKLNPSATPPHGSK
jgi:biopolymer transport protein ExbD